LVENNVNGEINNSYVTPINSIESIPIQNTEMDNDVKNYFLKNEKLKSLNEKIFSILSANKITDISSISEIDDDIKTISHYNILDKDMIIVTV